MDSCLVEDGVLDEHADNSWLQIAEPRSGNFLGGEEGRKFYNK